MKLNIGFFLAIATAGIVPAFAQPSLSITKTHTGNFTAGQFGATYTVTVSNAPSASPTTGMVTVTDTLPSGFTLSSMAGPGWICFNNSCSRSDALAGGTSYPPITVTVNVGPAASANSVNTASVSGGGSAPASTTDSTSVTIFTKPTLTVTKTHVGNFTPGQVGATYQVVVSNSINATPTYGSVFVTEMVPSGLTLTGLSGPGYSCYIAFGFCTRSDALNGGSSYPPLTVTVNVKPNATSPQVNMVSVSGGGSDTVTASDSTVIGNSTAPALTITKTHTGNFSPGQQGATYTITVNNTGTAATAGTVTVTDTVPSGETLVSLTGTGFSCSGNTCTRNDALTAGSSYPSITATVNVSANATSPQVNAASVSGGGSASASTTDSTVISNTPSPSLSISKTHNGNFTAGQTGTYTVTVSNAAGAGPSNGTVTVTENLPPGETLVSMSGSGYTCNGTTCTRTDGLAAGTSYPPITVTVNVAANAASPQVNSVGVSGGGSVAANTSDSTTVVQSGPSIVLPPTTNVDVTGTVVYQVSLSQPAGPNGVFVMLVSSDPSIANLNTPNAFIPQGGTTSNNIRVTGYKAGSVMISASAPGYASATGAVVVGAPPGSGSMSFSPASTTITTPQTQNLTLTLSSPAGPNGQTVTLQSSNTGVATVPNSVTVPANTTNVTVPVTSVGPGSATITANAPNFGATSAAITVVSSTGGPSIILQSGTVVNTNGSVPFSVSLSSPAPSGGVFITLSSSNPGVASTNTSSVFIPEGATTKGGIYLNGYSVGTSTITASAQGLPSTSVSVQVVQ